MKTFIFLRLPIDTSSDAHVGVLGHEVKPLIKQMLHVAPISAKPIPLCATSRARAFARPDGSRIRDEDDKNPSAILVRILQMRR
jgi:hypothetical protein